MTSDYGPRQASNDAAMFAIALLKARANAGSAQAATMPCTELLDAFENKLRTTGLRLLAAHLVEMTTTFNGEGPDAIGRLEACEMDTLRRQQTEQWPWG